MRIIAGVDGGGTKTKLICKSLDGNDEHVFGYGPFNINAIGEFSFRSLLSRIVDDIVRIGECEALCLGAAGVSNSNMCDIVSDVVGSSRIARWSLVGDDVIAMEGALDGGPGIIVISGTGSIVLGRDSEGNKIRMGGWGHLIGDEGSGYGLEHKDLIGLANYVRQFFPADTVWGIQGESMGSATAMMAAPHLPWLSFVSEDCGYSSMRKEMASTLKAKHLPQFPILNVGSMIMKSRYKLDMDKVSPETTVAGIEVPMLFCQGDHDTFVPTCQIYDVYGAKKDKKEIHLFKDSEHAESIWDHTDEYRQVVKEFLEKYKII